MMLGARDMVSKIIYITMLTVLLPIPQSCCCIGIGECLLTDIFSQQLRAAVTLLEVVAL